MKDSTEFTNRLQSQSSTEQALEKARKKLASQGIEPPVFTAGGDAGDYYDKMRQYSAWESALTVEYMRMPSGPRPIAFDSTPTGKGWTDK